MGSCLGILRKQRLQPELLTPATHGPQHSVVSATSTQCVVQAKVSETAAAGDQPQDVPPPLASVDESEEAGVPKHDPQPLVIFDTSPGCAVQEQDKEEPTASGACEQVPHVSPSSGATNKNEEIDIDVMPHSGQPPVISNSSPGCAEQEQGAEEVPDASEQLQHVSSGSTENEEIVITAIRATDVALGLRRLPAGFYVVLHHNGLEWRTENKPSSVNNDVVEWTGPIPISSDLSAVVRLEIYASFEFQPMLGVGEQLQKLTPTVGQLLDHSGRDAPFTFFPKDGDVVSPCTSILVTVKQQKRGNCDPSGSRVVGPHWSTPAPRGELEDTTNLGHSALTLYRKHERKQDLECSIQRFEHALSVCPFDDLCRSAAKSNLGMAKLILSQVEGTDEPLESALRLYRDTLATRPVGHPDRPLTLIQLASVHSVRLQRRKNHVDEEDAGRLLREAIELSVAESYEKQAAGVMLGLCARHGGGGGQSNGQSSMERDFIPILTDEDPQELSAWLLERFERFGDLADLQQGITILEGLVQSTSSGDSNYYAAQGNLGVALGYRFEHVGQLIDLEDAISRTKEAVQFSPDGHPHNPTYLNSLGNLLETRFSCLGQLTDLEDAISSQREAVRLSLDGHPDKPMYLSNLGNSLQTRFSCVGQLTDLEDAISSQREAVHLSPDDHPYKPAYVSNLGTSLQTRFSHIGQLTDLEDAISRMREAVQLSPDGHPDNPIYLSDLGNSLQTRFLRLGQLTDLEDAISSQREAVRLSPDGHPDRPGYLNNLGNSLEIRFSCLGQLADLEDAISSQREAVQLSPDGHPNNPIHLNNLGNSLETRFSRLGQLTDLEDAISSQREAVRLSPDGHPVKPGCLNNLANSLLTRFLRLGQLTDLEDAISSQKEAILLTPHDHPEKPARMNNLAQYFVVRFHRFRKATDLEHAISLSSHVASIPIGPPNVRFSAAQRWIQSARLIRHSSLLHAYSVAVGLLPQLAWIGLSLSHRYDELTQSSGFVQEAAAMALEVGLPETALEWLEQGRSIVWGNLFQLRNSYDELSSAHPDHASRLRALSTDLDQASAAHERSLSSVSARNQSEAHNTAKSLQQVADRHRALAIERDKLLQDIRRLPGFERFLLRKPFSQLRAAAHSGPVVILNAAETRCDALVVVAGLDHIIHVPLPNFTSERCANLQVILKGLVRETRNAKTVRWQGVSWDHILSPLWKCIVKPVLDALAFSVAPEELSRIFWCPTGPLAFFPIHAAGFYNSEYSETGHKVFDFVVSSYVPSLATLLPSLSSPAIPNDRLRLLAVRQPASDGQAPLSGVITELAYIKDVIERFPSAQTILVGSSVGTVEEVLQLMKESDWVHFACHGAQDGVNSGLCLADRRRLTLRDIVAVSRPRGGLAFLSACQTATGERSLSDEAIHIAAGMLFAGFGGVIGTMWSISDHLAPRVARDVYTELLEKGTRPDYREAARALQETIGRLRNQEVPFEEWIPFIHVGL